MGRGGGTKCLARKIGFVGSRGGLGGGCVSGVLGGGGGGFYWFVCAQTQKKISSVEIGTDTKQGQAENGDGGHLGNQTSRTRGKR